MFEDILGEKKAKTPKPKMKKFNLKPRKISRKEKEIIEKANKIRKELKEAANEGTSGI